jgi:hypothetical protein
VVRRALPRGADPRAAAERLRTGASARFFFDAEEAAAIVAALGGRTGSWRERVRTDAERICAGHYRVLGADDVRLADPWAPAALRWHEDLLSGYRWDPGTFYRKVEVPYGRADIKFPWEVSRCQHLAVLGIAFNVTGDRRYADLIRAQLEHWLSSNRHGRGVNWACTMDVAIRAINWLWALRLISPTARLEDDFAMRLLAALVLHGRHIERNIERYAGGITTNHTLADYAGLLHLGILLPDLADAARWTDIGRSGILECMDTQVLPDGVDYENSIPYHRLVLEMFLACDLLAKRNGRPFGEGYRRKLERMVEFVAAYTRPDGRAPIVGDSDDGRLHILTRYFDWDPHDHRYLLLIGARLFDREDLAAVAGESEAAVEEAAWLLGRVPQDHPRTADRRPAVVDLGSRSFPASGRYLMRGARHYALVCADAVGTAGLGNHKHNDLLSFELSVAGVPLVVDPGSYVYTSDPAWRDRFRSTRAHSTVCIDDLEQNEMNGSFGMRLDARVGVTRFDCGPSYDVFEGFHTGYRRLGQPVTHRRTIVFGKAPLAMLVIDRLEGAGEHRVDSRLRLAPDSSLDTRFGAPQDQERDLLEEVVRRHGSLALPPLGAGVSISRAAVEVTVFPFGWGDFAAEEGWYSPRYGQRVPAPVLRLAARLSCPAVGGYFLIER